MDVDRFMQDYLASLPADYVPAWSFAATDGEGSPQLYAWQTHPFVQEQWRNPGFQIPEGYQAVAIPSQQDLGTDSWGGKAQRIDYNDPNLPEDMRRDLEIWNTLNGQFQNRDDSFHSFLDLAFGDVGFFPALFAGGMMGADLVGGLLGAGAAGAGGVGETIMSPLPVAGAEGAGALAAGDAAALGGAVLSPLPETAIAGSAGAITPAAAETALAGGAGLGLGSLGGAAALAAPLIGAGGAIAGGIIGGNAAENAAQTQADAAREANATLLALYNQARADATPYREAGYQALGQLQSLAGQPLSVGQYTAPGVLDPSGYAFDPHAYAFDASSYAFDPNAYAFNGSQYAFNPSDYAFTATTGQQVLDDDPGYQFRISEGMKALEGAAAARGGLLSGGALKGIQQYGQGLASQEYGNAYNRALGRNQMAYQRALEGNQLGYNRALTENQMGYQRGLEGNQLGYNRALTGNQMGYERGLTGNQLAYGRAQQQNADTYARGLQQYQTNLGALTGLRSQQYNELASLAGLGQTTQGQLNQLGANYGTAAADNITGAGAAQAAGQIGQANALPGALSGVGGAANQYLQYQLLSSLLRR